MKYLKLFEEFFNAPAIFESKISQERSKGSVNWFTKDEINEIRARAKELGVPRIFEKAKPGVLSFFGHGDGTGGLKESVKRFFTQGGDLCNTVSINTKRGDYRITKSRGEFKIEGVNSGSGVAYQSDVSSVLNMMK